MGVLRFIGYHLCRAVYRMLRFLWAWCVAGASLYFFLRFLAFRWLSLPVESQNHSLVGPIVTWLCSIITDQAALDWMTHAAVMLGAIFVAYWLIRVLRQERSTPAPRPPP